MSLKDMNVFPVTGTNPDGGTFTFLGLNLLMYFMAHAPAEPQEWFKPTIDDGCLLEPVPQDFNLEEKDNPYHAEDYEGSSEDLALYFKAKEIYRKLLEEFNEELKKQRYLQWPKAYALEQIKQLEGEGQ